jgi:hypothetical protein
MLHRGPLRSERLSPRNNVVSDQPYSMIPGMAKGISVIEGRARREDGSEVVVYRALRQLLCSACGAPIRDGTLFTRRVSAGGGLQLAAQCRECVPFEPEPEAVKGQRSKLLESFFSAEPAEQPRAVRPNTDANEAMLKRLGPALRRRDGKSSR